MNFRKKKIIGKRDLTKKWEVSLMELENNSFKVTRRFPALLIAETKIFKTKEEAKEQFEEWLR